MIVDNDFADTERRYLSAISHSIGVVAAKFRDQPASFLYESDLQGLIFAELFARLSDSEISWTTTERRWSRISNGKPLIINPVKTEYPSGQRFDIAVIQPGPFADAMPWDQHVRAAIEIKFWQADGTGGGYERDVKKLEDYAGDSQRNRRRFSGVCAVFSHRSDKRFISEYFSDRERLNPTNLSLKQHGIDFWVFTPKEN